MEEKEGLKIEVAGVVQGVGFRPFLFNLAEKHRIKGTVRNTRKGVEIIALGKKADLNNFVDQIKNSPPPLALIKEIKFESHLIEDLENFSILSSDSGSASDIYISPDVAICNDCVKDFFSVESRYYKFPFVNCTNCGPRFSIIKDSPYDRNNTTMDKFEMCDECKSEYEDITSRRYHAQPISCNSCGPEFKLYDKHMNTISTDDPFALVTKLLKKGSIIAVKGIGGYHLILDAKNSASVLRLRERKKRDRKPFALLFKDKEVLNEYVFFNQYEEKILDSKEKPILLLKKRKSINDISPDPIAQGSPYYGVMLPYAPFHYLILQEISVLVCTSANISGEPIVYKDTELGRISGLADYYLVHNRDIVRYVEDSVVKVIFSPFSEKNFIEILFRKSRGYVPAPLFLKKSYQHKLMGLGSDLKATISILNQDSLIQSQYIGDLVDYESYQAYQETIDDFKEIFDFDPDIYVCDLHPSFLSVRYAEQISKGKKLIKVQHHKAHIASVCLENHLYDEDVIGIALDGTGYGEDGMIWGGEIFFGNLKDGFKRKGHLSYQPFPFGDVAIKEPEKTFLSYLISFNNEERLLNLLSENTIKNLQNLTNFVKETKLFTSSCGRLFDCVSFLLGFRKKVSYEGEPAIELENLIYNKFKLEDQLGDYKVNINEKEPYFIDVAEFLNNIISDYFNGADKSLISIKFHLTLVNAFMEVAKKISSSYKCKKIVFSGGSFQNSYLTYHFFRRSYELGLTPFINIYSPPNDACISVGQCALA